MSVNSKMTAIADKIRTLVGASGTMTLDAMATNVGTANTAVVSAITALTDKGVTVPDGTNVTGLAELISAIEAGGGKVASGSLVFESDTVAKTIVYEPMYGSGMFFHRLGAVPNFYAIISYDADKSITGKYYLKGAILFCPDLTDVNTYIGGLACKTSTSATTWNVGGSASFNNAGCVVTAYTSKNDCLFYGASDVRVYLSLNYNENGTVYQAGATYHWVMGVI